MVRKSQEWPDEGELIVILADGLSDKLIAEILFEIIVLQPVDIVASVVHRSKDKADRLLDAQRLAHIGQGFLQQVHPVDRVILCLHRH